MRAQILQHKEADDREIFELYKEAVSITIPRIDEVKLCELILSVEELNLALEYRKRTIKGQDTDGTVSVYEEFLEYIANADYDTGVKAKIYPKIVVYMCKAVLEQMGTVKEDERKHLYKRMEDLCHESLALLMYDDTSFYMIELFEVYEEIIKNMISGTKDENKILEYNEILERTEECYKTLKGVYEQYGVSPYMHDGCYLYREKDVHCINDVIRKRRKMKNMTVEELCDGICSERTIKRAERRETRLQKGIADELFKRLDIVAEYMNTGIITDSKEAVNLYERFRRAINDYDLDKAEEILDMMQEMLPEHPLNVMMLLKCRSIIEKKRGDISNERHIENMERVLSCSVDLNSLYGMEEEIYLSFLEVASLYSMAITLKKMKKYEEAHKSIYVLVRYYTEMEREGTEDSFISTYEMTMSAYASLIGSMGRYEESNLVSHKLIKLCLKLRRTNMIHLNIYNIGWNIREQDGDAEKYRAEIKRCIDLCQLTGNKYYSRIYKKEIG